MTAAWVSSLSHAEVGVSMPQLSLGSPCNLVLTLGSVWTFDILMNMQTNIFLLPHLLAQRSC